MLWRCAFHEIIKWRRKNLVNRNPGDKWIVERAQSIFEHTVSMILTFQFEQVPRFRRENIREAKNHNWHPFGEHAASLTEINKISTLDLAAYILGKTKSRIDFGG
jgi:hypothetical protein